MTLQDYTALVKTRRKIAYSITALVGYILSPASWWNDLIVNIPLALLAARLLQPLGVKPHIAFVAAYWATNMLGITLMIVGSKGLLSSKTSGKDLATGIAASILYTLIAAYILAL
ncbi:MAG: hypothetical protein F7C38_01575 [Desulfurococcales archaeon]|nr:hypothetical protein [Desulfurococcales archaeon]